MPGILVCKLLMLGILVEVASHLGSSSCSNSATLKFDKNSTMKNLVIKFNIKFEKL
jgi:hypothetical protein